MLRQKNLFCRNKITNFWTLDCCVCGFGVMKEVLETIMCNLLWGQTINIANIRAHEASEELSLGLQLDLRRCKTLWLNGQSQNLRNQLFSGMLADKINNNNISALTYKISLDTLNCQNNRYCQQRLHSLQYSFGTQF